tara:strand:+ start:3317 stop:3913 length:597 start_codon:yes stop_codon:yes gene_type:complete
MRNRLIIFGACSAAVGALVIGISVLSDPVFKLEIDPTLQNHFSNDKENWWKELPVEVLPLPSGVHGVRNHEGLEAAKEQLRKLIAGRSILGDLPIVGVSPSKDGSVEMVLSKETADCGTMTDEVRLKRRGFVDIDNDGVAEQCVFLGRAERTDTCGYGSGSFLGYGDWYVLGKRTKKSEVKLLEVREAECGDTGSGSG